MMELLSDEYRGLWQDRSYEPQPGDIMFFDWDDPGGFSGPQDGMPNHVGVKTLLDPGQTAGTGGSTVPQ